MSVLHLGQHNNYHDEDNGPWRAKNVYFSLHALKKSWDTHSSPFTVYIPHFVFHGIINVRTLHSPRKISSSTLHPTSCLDLRPLLVKDLDKRTLIFAAFIVTSNPVVKGLIHLSVPGVGFHVHWLSAKYKVIHVNKMLLFDDWMHFLFIKWLFSPSKSSFLLKLYVFSPHARQKQQVIKKRN